MTKRILVIEDDPNTLRFVEYTLEHGGYQVVSSTNGLEGLKKAQDEHPDLIILDVMLPGLDGYEVCHRLRLKPETAHVPILMFSAKARQEDIDTGLKIGADGYLAKPVAPSEIITKIESLLTDVSKLNCAES